jgi:dTDP-glucose 4,6-dehydratase
MKTVLITGVGGFMGSHTLRHVLTTTDWKIIGIDSFRHMGKTDRITQQLSDQDLSRLTLIRHDLTVPFSEQFEQKLKDIDYVLNIASESHVDRSITDPREFTENNVALILTMLEWLKKRNNTPIPCNNFPVCDDGYPGNHSHFNPVKSFIHISTDEVYGPATDHNHKEGEPYRPSNPYSASKAAQEAICYAYWRTYNLPIVITNTMNIIGEMQDPEKFVPKVMKQIANGEKVTIHASKDGQPGSRYYLHARNQADALCFLLKNIVPTRYPAKDLDRFNIVGEKEVNNLEMAELIAKFYGAELNYELVDFHSSRPGHDLRYGLDNTKLKELGWVAPFSFEESLKSTIEWTKNHPEWLL